MTDGEPEPFRMPTDQDADQDAAGGPAADGAAGNDADEAAAPADERATDDESIADLIDEAARTVAERAQAPGRAPENRSAEVWGEDGTGDGADAVWQQSEDDATSNVWDTDDGDGEAVWGTLAPETTTPARATDEPETDEEPEASTFAVADDDVDEVDDVWTSPVANDDETPLAESASPRHDAGWHDLEAEQEPAWSVPDLPVGDHGGDQEEPAGFTATLDDGEAGEDDAPWSSPALPDEPAGGTEHGMPPAGMVAAEVHDALGDLLGNGEQDAQPEPEPEPAETAGGGVPFDLDDLDDFDHLEDLEDMAAAAAVPAADEPAGDEQAGDEQDDDPDADADPERPLDAPTAARQVMEPGSVTFSSSGRKKRGLFG